MVKKIAKQPKSQLEYNLLGSCQIFRGKNSSELDKGKYLKKRQMYSFWEIIIS